MDIGRTIQAWRQTTIANKAIAISSTTAAVATVVYVIVASFQLCSFRESNRINHDALESVQRAFVSFKTVSLYTAAQSWRSKGQMWTFSAEVENSGTTPAIDKIQYFDGKDRMKSEPTESDFLGTLTSYPVGEIGPKALSDMGPIVKDDQFILGTFRLDQIATKEYQDFFDSNEVYFWGWVGYRDVFPDTKAHVTEFCERVAGIGADLMPGSQVLLFPKLQFTACASHNCTDKHCDDYDSIAAKVPK